MAERRGWSEAAHRYADGDGPAPADGAARGEVESFVAAAEEYRDGLPSIDPALDDRVMAAVLARPRPGAAGWWARVTRPRAITVRPILAAAAAVALVVGSSALTLLVRGPAPEERPAATEPGTILVRFELHATQAERVALAGSFNGWSDSSIVFARGPEPGLWTVTVALAPGRYQYLFVVDGERWIPDPMAHAQIEDEFGQQNSLIVVGPRGVVRS